MHLVFIYIKMWTYFPYAYNNLVYVGDDRYTPRDDEMEEENYR